MFGKFGETVEAAATMVSKFREGSHRKLPLENCSSYVPEAMRSVQRRAATAVIQSGAPSWEPCA